LAAGRLLIGGDRAAFFGLPRTRESPGESFRQKLRRIWPILQAAFNAFIADGALSRGAAIAYYSIFAIAPILLITTAAAGVIFGEKAAQNAIVEEFSGLMGPAAAELLQQIILGVSETRGGMLGTILGLGTLFLTATGVFGEIQSALNAIWKAHPRASTISLLLRARLMSLGLVLALGFLLIVSLLASAALSALSTYLRNVFPALPLLLAVVDLVLSLSLTAILVGAIYKFLPDTPIEWRDVRIGAGVSALLLTAGKWFIGIYVAGSGVASAYGAASALVVILLWVYYCAQIFLFGAEITYAYSQQTHRNAVAQPGQLHRC
jgi:membrane protein